jgi:hypothetical protein
MFVTMVVGCVSQQAFQSPVVSPMQPLSSLASPTVTPADTPLPTPTNELNAVEAALAFAKEALPTFSGTPKVILTRSITYKDYPKLGLGNFSSSTGSQPALQLVLLQGAFDTRNYGLGTKLPFVTAAYVIIVTTLITRASRMSPYLKKAQTFRNY